MFSKTGNTTISGNLTINGNTVELNSDNVNIKNNTILLNSKETSNKISSNVAGLEINRGTSAKYQIVYDEQDQELKSGLSNNLKPISNEEYAHNNINNTKTNLNTQIYKNDFINELPKIGYYQEDTVEVLSKYNMNYMANESLVLTTESNKQEIMYFIANDGGPDSINNLKLYRGYRADDNQAFLFDNEPLIPKYFSSIGANGDTTKVNSLLGGDNNYIVASIIKNGQGSAAWHLINTAYTSDCNKWTSYKDITSIVNSGGTCYQIKYLQEYGTIIGIFLLSTSCHYENPIRFRVYRYSDLSLIKEYPLANPFTLIQLNENYSFNNKEKINNAWDEKNICTMNTISGWCRMGFMYYEKQELLVMICNSMHSSWYNWDNTTNKGTTLSDSYNLPCKMVWNVPISVAQGKTIGNISLINTIGDWVINGTFTSWMSNCSGNLLNSSNQFNKYTSYDTINGRTYVGGKYRDSGVVVRAVRFNNSEQKFEDDDPTRKEYQGTVGGYLFGTYLELPDASLWGKQVFCAPGYWDHLMVNGNSKQGISYLWIKKWKFVSGYETKNYIEPVPGNYQKLGSRPGIFTQVYDSSAKDTDGNARYFRTWYNSSMGGIRVQEFKHTTDRDDNIEITLEELKVFPFNPTQSTIYNRLGSNVALRCCAYNPVGDYVIVMYQNNHTDSETYSFAHKMYFSLILSSGEEIFFGPDFDEKLRSCGVGTRNDTVYGWLPTNVAQILPQCVMTLSKTRLIWNHSYFLRDSNYGSNYVCIDLTDNLRDIASCKNVGAGNCYSHSNYQRASHIYLGNKLGILCIGNGWTYRPMRWAIQKPLILTDNAKYPTEDEFLANPGNNGNTYYMYLQASQGLVCYVPSIPIFLGGYFETIQNPISVNLQPNTNNYIYLERDFSTKELKAYALTTKNIEEGSKQFSRILLARILTNEANPIETEYYRINTGYNDYTFYHKITIKQTPNQTIHVYTTENGQRVDHTTSFFVKINSNIQYSIEIKPDLWCAAGTLQNISSSGIIDKNLIVSATPAKLISTNYSYPFKMEYASSNNPPIYRFGNNYSATYPDGQNYSGQITPIDQLGIYTNLDSVIHYQYAKPLPDGIKSVFIKLVCKDGEHFLGHFMRDEFDQYGDVYHSKVLGTQENLNLFKRLYDTKEVFTCVTGIET